MPKYIYERPDFPDFYWDSEKILAPLSEVRFMQGRFSGKIQSLGFDIQQESNLLLLEKEIITSSQIEGEIYKPEEVRSSIAKRTGAAYDSNQPTNRNIDGFVDLLLDATQNYATVISKERLFNWHGALFPTGRSGLYTIKTAQWRKDEKGPMQVVSGGFGNEKVHYEAPTASLIPNLMIAFLDWLNTESQQDLIIKTGIAHLWFLTIHPFEDGNGRIARAISESILAKSENDAMRFYSLSSQILKNKKDYYLLLEQSQKGNLDCTNWLLWFLETLKKAIIQSEEIISTVLQKANFWKNHEKTILSPRQQKMLEILWNDFEGNLTTKKWSLLTKCSDDSALRDINDLILKGILYKEDKGSRSTSYKIILS
jgi:Fic family protein